MTDDFERRVRDWMGERARADGRALEALAGYVAVLPPRRPDRRRPLAAAAAIIVLLGLAALALPRLGHVGEAPVPTVPVAPRPPDPAAFAGDPRLASCGASVSQVDFAFEIPHARDYREALPRMGRSPELEVDDSAFVVVFNRGMKAWIGRDATVSGAPSASATPADGDLRQVCILVGETPHAYDGVDVTGLRVTGEVPSAAEWTEPAAYTYVLESSCGERALIGRFRVHVANGQTVAAEPLDDPASRYLDNGGHVPSIGDLLREREDARAHRAESIAVLYAPDGRPASIQIDWQRAAIDDEACYTITDFQVAPGEPTPAARPTTEPMPSWAAELDRDLRCDTGLQWIGAADPAGPGRGSSGPTAEDALAAFLQGNAELYSTLPLGGFEPVRSSEDWTLFGHVYGDGVRAAALFHRNERGVWSLSNVAACDAAEFDPAIPLSGNTVIWVDKVGQRVPTDHVFEREDCYGGSIVRIDGKLFARDTTGEAFAPELLLATYSDDVTLPNGVIDTGYRRRAGSGILYVADDARAAYIAFRDSVERLPRVKGDEYSRTDCN